MRESKFQSELIKELKVRFEGCIVLKNDSGYLQGVPDLLVLYGNRWAALECKASHNSARQPNQDYWVGAMDTMSFAAYIHPTNKDDVLNELTDHFRRNGRR